MKIKFIPRIKLIPRSKLRFAKEKNGKGAIVWTHAYVHKGKINISIHLEGKNIETFGNGYLRFDFKPIPFNAIKSNLSSSEILRAIDSRGYEAGIDARDRLHAVYRHMIGKKLKRAKFFYKKNEMLWASLAVGDVTLGPVEGQSIGAIY